MLHKVIEKALGGHATEIASIAGTLVWKAFNLFHGPADHPHLSQPSGSLSLKRLFLVTLAFIAAISSMIYYIRLAPDSAAMTGSLAVAPQTVHVWGTSHLSEIAGGAHKRLADAKVSLSAFKSKDFVTDEGSNMMSWSETLGTMSLEIVVELNSLTQKIRRELTFLFFVYQEVHTAYGDISGLSRLKGHVSLSNGARCMLQSLKGVEVTAFAIASELDLLIAQTDRLLSVLSSEIMAREGGFIPWNWWRKGQDERLVAARRDFTDALDRLKKARLGVRSLHADLLSLISDADPEQDVYHFLPETTIIGRHILGIVGMRVSRYLRTEGEVDTVAVISQRVLEAVAVGSRTEIESNPITTSNI